MTWNVLNYSKAISFKFAVNLIEGQNQCSIITAATLTGESPQIYASFIMDASDQGQISDFSVVFKTPSENLQYGSSLADCSGFRRLGDWSSQNSYITGSRDACNFLTSEGSRPLNLLLGFTEVCIHRSSSSCDNSIRRSSVYYSGELMISGFRTSSTHSTDSTKRSPCKVGITSRSK